jgi:hypothetical protein
LGAARARRPPRQPPALIPEQGQCFRAPDGLGPARGLFAAPRRVRAEPASRAPEGIFAFRGLLCARFRPADPVLYSQGLLLPGWGSPTREEPAACALERRGRKRLSYSRSAPGAGVSGMDGGHLPPRPLSPGASARAESETALALDAGRWALGSSAYSGFFMRQRTEALCGKSARAGLPSQPRGAGFLLQEPRGRPLP